MRYLLLTLSLLAAGCQPEYHRAFDDPHCEPEPMTRLAYGDAGVVHLQGRVGMAERLPLVADSPLEVRWTSADRRAVELEVQVQVVHPGSLDPQTLAETVYWKIRDHAHGDVVYDYHRFAALGGAAVAPTWSVPARGVRARLSARELIVGVMHRDVAATQGPLVRVSIEPVDGALVPVWPQSVSLGADFRQPLPMGATELRIAGVAPATDIQMRDMASAVLSTAPASAFADWTLIEPNAVTLAVSPGPAPAGAVVAFR